MKEEKGVGEGTMHQHTHQHTLRLDVPQRGRHSQVYSVRYHLQPWALGALQVRSGALSSQHSADQVWTFFRLGMIL